ncbi:hypothetical protein H0I23_00625 [Cellulophaga sp. HaHaR_3_176]|uniref:coiled-coil domain-containing protein n=1 Tax=Cellulophaga sp. HaHaR_3_176 TaxID=1942464 RepID=UPI001C1FDF11|nr:hypothetical protein [Cellulophaga sp. HaHaR_3_176]QWX84188.1 hypothetical protein H0I23_00625 [Cellulophaga sp. HaHaR_3_176]
MKINILYIAILYFGFLTQNVLGQEDYKSKIINLNNLKSEITLQEKEALKAEVASIMKRVDTKEITEKEAQQLKEDAAKKRALNIENRLSIVDNEIALLERNGDRMLVLPTGSKVEINFGSKDGGDDRLFGLKIDSDENKNKLQYDRRTSSDFVIAVGLNNAIIDNQSLDDSPYEIGGSRFFEMGWQWRTRVFKNTNFMRFNYGFSFQFNGLKAKDNQYFVVNNGQTILEEFQYDLDKSKLRMDNLVFPIHFEFGPSKLTKTDKTIRYDVYKKFRFGIGGYGGFNLSTRQKLKYEIDGDKVKDKLKRGYNTSNLIYGLSAYAGFGGTQLYVKYDLNPIFKDAIVEQRNVSLGLRFDLD